ncbi:MAG: ROK family protein [Chloroflexota bacterium]|nr:ROK family protein [Chloroflexota bacterium]
MNAASPDPVLAIDIGGTSLRLALIGVDGRLHGEIASYDVPFASDGAADLAGLFDLMTTPVERARQSLSDEPMIGVSLCGNVDLDSGDAILAPNLGWRNLPFGRLLSERFCLPVCVATDVRQAVLAEAIWGAGMGLQDFAWATVGTGYGGYLFLNGRLYGGAHGFAGNFGHITLDEVNGYPCGCGRRGCFETFVAGPAIARAGQAACEAGQSAILSSLALDGEVTTPMVFRAIELGDEAATAIVDEAIRLICINLGGMVNLLDLSLIVMGGGVTEAAPWFIERVSSDIRAYLMTTEARRDLRVLRESMPNAALWGAAAHVFAAEGLFSGDVRGDVLEEGIVHRAIRAW